MIPQAENKERRIRFDPTVNLGHIITFVGFLIAIFTAWTTLDKRVVVLEEGRKAQESIDRQQDQRVLETRSEIHDSLQEIKRGMDRLYDKLERGK